MRISTVAAHRLPRKGASGPSSLALAISAENGSVGWAGIPPAAAIGLDAGPLPALAGLVGADARAIDAIVDDLRRAATGRTAALAGPVDIALHDLKARSLGVPIVELLGGRYRERVAVHAVVELDDPDATPAFGLPPRKVRARIGAGRLSRRDAEARRIRSAIGATADRRADGAALVIALEGRPPLPAILAVVRALDDIGPERIELDDIGPERLEMIVAATRTPIASGTGLVGAAGLRPTVERHLSPIVVVDVALNGFSEARRMADLAAHFDALVVPADATDALGLLAALGFAGSQPTAALGFAVAPAGAHFAGFDADPPALEDGALIAPDGPGLGAAPSVA